MDTAKIQLITFKSYGDDEGVLIPLESEKNIPFEIKRVYYIHTVKAGAVRGKHAHYQLAQILIAISGCVEVTCESKGEKHTYILDSRDKGLLIEGMVWHTMQKFSSDAILLVLANDFYNEDDYVREYDVFLEEDVK